MAYASGTLDYNENHQFNGFFSVHLVFTLTAEVNDAKNKLTVRVTKNKSTWSSGTRNGFGFINFGGLLWEGAAFGQAAKPTNGFRAESYAPVLAQMRSLSGSKIPNDVIYGVYCSDNAAKTYRGTIQTSYSRSWTLTPSDFDSAGNMKPRRIIRYAARWYSDGQYGWPADYAVVNSDTSISIDTDRLHWDYFPFAVRLSGQWKSCNRAGGVSGAGRMDSGRLGRTTLSTTPCHLCSTGAMVAGRGLRRSEASKTGSRLWHSNF